VPNQTVRIELLLNYTEDDAIPSGGCTMPEPNIDQALRHLTDLRLESSTDKSGNRSLQ